MEVTPPYLEAATHLNPAVLALEDGTVFEGSSFGAPVERTGEVVFNTAITGYQVSTPPSSVGKVCAGNPSTAPPDSTPRIREHQPYILNERLMFTAMANLSTSHNGTVNSPPVPRLLSTRVCRYCTSEPSGVSVIAERFDLGGLERLAGSPADGQAVVFSNLSQVLTTCCTDVTNPAGKSKRSQFDPCVTDRSHGLALPLPFPPFK